LIRTHEGDVCRISFKKRKTPKGPSFYFEVAISGDPIDQFPKKCTGHLVTTTDAPREEVVYS
jgi:hypothetical protein